MGGTHLEHPAPQPGEVLRVELPVAARVHGEIRVEAPGRLGAQDSQVGGYPGHGGPRSLVFGLRTPEMGSAK